MNKKQGIVFILALRSSEFLLNMFPYRNASVAFHAVVSAPRSTVAAWSEVIIGMMRRRRPLPQWLEVTVGTVRGRNDR